MMIDRLFGFSSGANDTVANLLTGYDTLTVGSDTYYIVDAFDCSEIFSTLSYAECTIPHYIDYTNMTVYSMLNGTTELTNYNGSTFSGMYHIHVYGVIE